MVLSLRVLCILATVLSLTYQMSEVSTKRCLACNTFLMEVQSMLSNTANEDLSIKQALKDICEKYAAGWTVQHDLLCSFFSQFLGNYIAEWLTGKLPGPDAREACELLMMCPVTHKLHRKIQFGGLPKKCCIGRKRP
ncbi:hypothetical protein KIN20_014319 [Parelaphostrongylus tenuis]|uniref:Saposin B-type domain-containing protein n=1 Tax=Parelaphostrongylus tenuis TaxID=148309 RepID=A0AAD5MGZ6_PARTN|nr:hypothetical protein KIN20_014319 [Parelaphostrongylus tenuis]